LGCLGLKIRFPDWFRRYRDFCMLIGGEDYCPVVAPEEDYSKMSNEAIEMSHSDKEGPARLCAFALGIWVRRLRPPCASLWPLAT